MADSIPILLHRSKLAFLRPLQYVSNVPERKITMAATREGVYITVSGLFAANNKGVYQKSH